jgi:DNA-binding transcriptional LysR family regulator
LIADQDGEALGALAALKRSLASAGLDAHDLVAAFERGMVAQDGPETKRSDDAVYGDIRSTVWFCWHRRNRLGPKEREFVENICKRRTTPTDRQRVWILDIADRLERGAAA